MELVLNNSTIKTDPKRYLVNKQASKVEKYLISFNIPVSLDLDENCKRVVMNKSVLKQKFDAKKKLGMTPKNFEAYESSENYENDLDSHFDNIEAEHNFEGFESDFSDFLPILAGLGKGIVKGGVKMIKNKIDKNRAKKAGTANSTDPNSVYSTLRNNVLDLGMDRWLTDSKKSQIESIIKKGELDKQKSLIKSQLVEVGVNPARFHSFEDATGNYSGKAKDILTDILGEYKAGETAKAKNEATPKLILIAVLLVAVTYFVAKS